MLSHKKRIIFVCLFVFCISGCINTKNNNQNPYNSDKGIIKIVDHCLDVKESTQETNYYCGPATIQMVLNYHGINVSQDQLAKEVNITTDRGTEYVDLCRVVNKYVHGKEYQVQTMEMNDTNPILYQQFEQRVKKDIASGNPVFLTVNLNTLYPTLPSANHLVVCTGYASYENTDEIVYYYILDPYYVVQEKFDGALQKVPKETLFKSIYSNVEPAYIW